jgi:hypothetical protein
MRRYRINEAIVEDPDFVEKIKKFAELSDKIDEVTANLKSLKREYDDIEVHIRPILEQLKITKDKALQVENILITIKKAGGDKKNIKYKDAFNWLYSRVNAQMQAIIDESIKKNMTISRVASSISVQKLSENKLRKSLTSAVGRITSLLKPFISFLSKKNQEIDKTITDFKKEHSELLSETKIQPTSATMVGMDGFSRMNESKRITLNEFKSLIKRIIKEEKNNLTKNQVKKMLREGEEGRDFGKSDKYSDSSVNGSLTIDDLPNNDVLDIKFTGGWVRGKYSPDIDWHIEEAILYTDKGEMEINIYEPKYAELLKIADDAISNYLDGEGIRY